MITIGTGSYTDFFEQKRVYIKSLIAMNEWSKIKRKHFEKYLRDSLSFSDSEEITFIKESIKKEFPMLEDAIINLCIKHCSNIVAETIPIDLFIVLLKRKLNIFMH